MTTHLSLRHPPSKPQADRHTHSQSQHPHRHTHSHTHRPGPLVPTGSRAVAGGGCNFFFFLNPPPGFLDSLWLHLVPKLPYVTCHISDKVEPSHLFPMSSMVLPAGL